MRTYPVLVVGRLVDWLSVEVTALAGVWLVLQRGRSAEAVGVLLLVRGLVRAAGALVAGPILDRVDRRTVLVGTCALRAGILALLGTLASGDAVSLPGIYALLGADALLAAFTLLGPEMLAAAYVGPERLTTANALLDLASQMATLTGPAAGGLLASGLGAPRTLEVAGALLMAGAIIFLRLPPSPAHARAADSGGGRHLIAGIAYLAGHRGLRSLTALTFAYNFAYGPLEVALPVLVRDVLGSGPRALGALWSAFAAGWMAGGLLCGAIRWEGRSWAGLAASPLLWGILTVALPWAGGISPAAAMMASGGVVFAPYPILALTARQRATPDHLRGRVFSAYAAVVALGVPLGAALGGWMVSRAGVAGGVVGASALSVLLGVAAWRWPALRDLDAADGKSKPPPGG
ncbi:MAG: MFS transporter [Armatimonadota bacterium]|nr:MFS transporter [Armatimonadota bacterium]MDR7402439.1 MFS transporter [Armatimonadota bacterium]MDR7507121.1 MFS transporter [Armatimonadota bacterium]MDR7508752.1 MFS transporter [Armatimonadota bacterium]MDR7517741.1 MFS transporter [Armatimonadota bacterium]